MQGKSNRRLVLIGGAALLVLLLVVFARIRPLAPGSIDILTGPERSHYHAMGVRMSEELSKHGITARVVVTAGALDNLRQLRGRDDNAIALATSDI